MFRVTTCLQERTKENGFILIYERSSLDVHFNNVKLFQMYRGRFILQTFSPVFF